MTGLLPLAVGGVGGYMAGPTLLKGAIKKRDHRPLIGAAAGGLIASLLWSRMPSPYGAMSVTKACVGAGNSGASVVALQQQLAAFFGPGEWKVGNPIPADWADYFPASERGKMGSVTVSTLKKFQSAVGLSPDGIAGPATWAKVGFSGLPCGSAPASIAQAQAAPAPSNDLAEFEKQERKKKLLLFGGLGGGAALLLITILLATR